MARMQTALHSGGGALRPAGTKPTVSNLFETTIRAKRSILESWLSG